MRYGRNLPPVQARAPLRLSKYLIGAEPPPIVGVPKRPDWARGAWSGLADIDGNGEWGDCCYAGIMHLICVLIAATNLKHPFPSQKEALDLYKSVVPTFNPDDPSTDVGGDLPTVMAYVQQHGALMDGSFKLASWIAVDASSPIELKTAIWCFGGLYKGFGIPNAFLDPAPTKSGFVFDVCGPPNMNQGHCVMDYGADDEGTFMDTWGLEGIVTYAANAAYFTEQGAGECYAILWPDWIDRAKLVAPNGLDYAQLQADLKVL